MSRVAGTLTKALFALPPEMAHGVALWALGHGLAPRARPPERPRLATTLFGHRLAHPLGLAAGFDKDARALPALFGLGFAFVEVGTVTPGPQAGNPRPRLFRLRADQALINRLGFNNQGVDALRARLGARAAWPGPVGANIGMNRDTEDQIADYVIGLRELYDLVDYVAVNVSSPNTPGLRGLQAAARLGPLLDALLSARRDLAGDQPRKPLLVKIAPDLTPEQEAEIADVVLAKRVDGLIVCNTTLARPGTLKSADRNEPGGLSGVPLRARSTELLRRLARLTSKKLMLIGVGGIGSGADAYAKIRAGASALQLYTALIYQGPAVVPRILAELDACLARDGFGRLADAVGVDV